jgi:hypothetical protein
MYRLARLCGNGKGNTAHVALFELCKILSRMPKPNTSIQSTGMISDDNIGKRAKTICRHCDEEIGERCVPVSVFQVGDAYGSLFTWNHAACWMRQVIDQEREVLGLPPTLPVWTILDPSWMKDSVRHYIAALSFATTEGSFKTRAQLASNTLDMMRAAFSEIHLQRTTIRAQDEPGVLERWM